MSVKIIVMALRLSVAQPRCVPGDVRQNVAAHAHAIRGAASRLVVFPELSLTGYDLEATPIDLGAGPISEVVKACRETGSIALVGAPVRDEIGASFIAMVAVSAAGAKVVYRKVHLGGREPMMFTSGTEPGVMDVDGWRIGLGICRDTGVVDHVDETIALGIDLYVAGVVHAPEELPAQDARGERIARRADVPVAFASAAGPAGPGYLETAGYSTIWSANGTTLARAGSRPSEVVTVTVER
jgi:predicted amidohydrolase